MKHILLDKKFHHYSWIFDGKKATLYIDGKPAKKKDALTVEYWFKSNRDKPFTLPEIKELILSKCNRRKHPDGGKK